MADIIVLRNRVRIALPDEANGFNDEGSVQLMATIKKVFANLRQRLATARQYATIAGAAK